MTEVVGKQRKVDAETRALAENLATVCGMFANPKRILILWALAGQEKSVSQIASAVGASLQSTSQHLHLMRERGILDSRRDGRTIYYFIAGNDARTRCRHLLHSHPSIRKDKSANER